MDTTLQDEEVAMHPGLAGHVTALIASLGDYFRARLKLAGIEAKDAATIYIKVAALAAAAVALLLFGYVFLWVGLFALIAKIFYLHWGWFVLGAGLLHVLGALGCAGGIGMLWKKSVFPATLAEFRKDQEWLSSHK